MALPPYYVPRVPGSRHDSPGPADIAADERRLRLLAAVGLAVLLALVAAGVVAVELGLLADGLMATLLAVVFGLSLTGGIAVDVLAGLRRAPRQSRTGPGLRPASFLYVSALICMFATFAFLAF